MPTDDRVREIDDILTTLVTRFNGDTTAWQEGKISDKDYVEIDRFGEAKRRIEALIAEARREAVEAYENKVQDFAIETYVNSKVYEWAESSKHPKTNQNRYIGLEGGGYNSAQEEIEELLLKWRAEAAQLRAQTKEERRMNDTPTSDELASILSMVYCAGVQSTLKGATIRTPKMSREDAHSAITSLIVSCIPEKKDMSMFEGVGEDGGIDTTLFDSDDDPRNARNGEALAHLANFAGATEWNACISNIETALKSKGLL